MELIIYKIGKTAPEWEGLVAKYLSFLKPDRLLIEAIKPERDLASENQALVSRINFSYPVLVLTEHGQTHNTLEFSDLMTTEASVTGRIQFLIGGAFGFEKAVLADLKQKGAKLISLSPMTMQHDLALVVLLEQLFRVKTIREGRKYHY